MTEPQTDHWTRGHFLSLTLIVIFFAYMAIWRPFGLFTSWIVVMIAMAAFILIVGHGVKGVWRGAFIDNRSMVSLSRFQMLIWTIVILGAYGTMAIARVFNDPGTALDVVIPTNLLLLMGISTTSLVGSPLVKSVKEGKIFFNRQIEDAKWADLFRGEEKDNESFMDLAKVQMFFFTVLIVLAYGAAIGQMLRAETLPSGFPEIGEGMIVLLGISHAGYLTHKAIPHPEQSPQTSQNQP